MAFFRLSETDAESGLESATVHPSQKRSDCVKLAGKPLPMLECGGLADDPRFVEVRKIYENLYF